MQLYKHIHFLGDANIRIIYSLTNEIDDLSEYVKMAKFLNCENFLISVCAIQIASNIDCKKYLKLLRLLGEGKYLQNFFDELKLNINRDFLEEIDYTQKIFDILKQMWPKNAKIIEKREKIFLSDIAVRIKKKYRFAKNIDDQEISYELLKKYYNDAKQEYKTVKLLQKKVIGAFKKFWIGVFIVWNVLCILLCIGGEADVTLDIWYAVDSLVVMGIIITKVLKFCFKIIREKHFKN